MATIIAILIAVIVDRYAQMLPAGQFLLRVRSSSWLNGYLAKCISILERMGIKQAYLILLSAVLPICIGLLILKILFGAILGGLGTLIFVALVLFYFLGNRVKDPETDSASIFVLAHEHSFGVLFWFAVFGPTGAFLYWFLVASLQAPVIADPINENLRQALHIIHALAAWIPARISGFIYALMGNFDPGFKCWLDCVRDPKLPGSVVLQNCGQASLEGGTADADERLVTRTFIAWCVLIILICSI